ncbi:MAG: hypothetical protein ACOYN0_08075 [Phycisphaerales bacterium]
MLAWIVTILAVLGVVVMVACNAGMTGFFLRSPPRGDSAMGLVVPFAGIIGAAVLLVLASLIAVAKSGRTAIDLLHASPTASAMLTVIVTVGVVLAAFMAFAAWAEPVLVTRGHHVIKPLLGVSAGLLAPVVLGVALIVGVWMTPQWLHGNPKWLAAMRTVCWSLVATAALGYGLGGVVFGRPLIARISANRAALASLSPTERAARERYRLSTAEELLHEELDALASDAPLSSVVGYFVATSKKLNARCREMLVQRTLCVPDVDQQLIKVMGAKPYLYRWGAAEFLRHAAPEYVKAHQDAWAQALATGIDATAEAMSMRPAWLSETFDLNPEPLELVRSLLGAAERFEGHEGISASLRGMAAAANELKRDKQWNRLAKDLARAGYPLPAEGTP